MEYSLEPDGDKLLANLESVREQIDHACTQAGRPLQSVRLIAVTKMQPAATVQRLIDLGLKEFGESKVQEIVEKAPLLRGDFCLHMIGRLQTNKVKPALSHVGWIQSVDRERLIQAIESRHGGPQKIKALVEVNTSGEASKSGCMPEECRRICERTAASCALEFCGLMTIGPFAHPRKKCEKVLRSCAGLVKETGISRRIWNFRWGCRTIFNGRLQRAPPWSVWAPRW
jgi:PLP dependent protein